MPLDDRVIVIIGGSSGIGHELARPTSAQGARLIIAGRDEAKLAAALDKRPGVSR